MRRRALLLLAGFVIALFGVGGSVLGASASDPPRIAILLYNSRLQHGGQEHPVVLGLGDVGLIDGKTAAILVREAEGHPERLPQLAAELISQRPDVIVTAGPQPIGAGKDATATIPIVMAIVSDHLWLCRQPRPPRW